MPNPKFSALRPHSAVHGDSIARFYQGGHHFDGSHDYVTSEEAGVPGEQGQVMKRMRERREAEQASKADEAKQAAEAAKIEADRKAGEKAPAMTNEAFSDALQSMSTAEEVDAYLTATPYQVVQRFAVELLGVDLARLKGKKEREAVALAVKSAWESLPKVRTDGQSDVIADLDDELPE